MTLLPALSRFTRSRLLRLFSLALVAVLCNEFLIFYLKKAQHVLLIADTHLLGRRRGHWFDKLRREWQMHRSYVSAVSLLRPNAIFFLGDLLDEGAYSMPDEFAGYVERFRQLFGPAAAGVAVDVHALAGNHDLGFHYEIAPPRVEWFAKAFARERLVDVVSVGDIRFVLITSMAMHGDGCRLCYEAQKQLEEMATDFDCARRPTDCKRNPSSFAKLLPYSQPILLQHFPLFRPNDSVCERDEDFDHFDKTRNEVFRPQWECLDERSSHLLVRKVRPRVAFAGHTHRGCKRRWSSSNASFWEYTLNSFSWRNGNAPTFLLLTVTADDYAVSTCYLPQETTVFTVYALTSAVVLMFILRRLLSLAYGWIQRSRYELPTTKVHKQS